MADETENQTAEVEAEAKASDGGVASSSKVTAENLRVLENVEVQMTVAVSYTHLTLPTTPYV